MHSQPNKILSKTRFHMIDVGHKLPSFRRAIAQGKIHVGAQAIALIKANALPKGDVLQMAEITGVMGAKRTADLLPLCHPLGLEQVLIQTQVEEESASVWVYALVSAFAKTGVEMEALGAVNAALLAIYDLTKMVEPALTITDVRLLVKEGGKKGLWMHPEGIPTWLQETIFDQSKQQLQDISMAVLTVSDRAAAGEYEDHSGAILKEKLASLGATICHYAVVADEKEQISNSLNDIIAAKKPQVILTTGGTGLGPRDVTPEALTTIGDRQVPGMAELLRHYGSRFTQYAWLSRSCVVIKNNTLIISLPGSTKAVAEGIDALKEILPHAIKMMAGGGHD